MDQECFLMKQKEHSQKMNFDWSEHALRLEILNHQLAYYRGRYSGESQSRPQDDSPVTPESQEPTANSQQSESPASG